MQNELGEDLDLANNTGWWRVIVYWPIRLGGGTRFLPPSPPHCPKVGTHTDKALCHDEVQRFTRLHVESSIACVTLGESFLLYGPIKWSDQMPSKGSCTGAVLDSMNYLWKQLVGSTSISGRLQVGKAN